MNINAVNFNSVQKTNFGLMTQFTEKHLKSIIKAYNLSSSVKEKFKFLTKNPDFILSYDNANNDYIFLATSTHDAQTIINPRTPNRTDYDFFANSYINANEFIENLFNTSLRLLERTKDKNKSLGKRSNPLTVEEVEATTESKY